ncbi:MAG: SufD family Fe-S cluster assembly protein [Lachnospiraceae bacterium]|nr:SufD family Fe-S cluster assembly protein [Lachnospiraceae bacterium]
MKIAVNHLPVLTWNQNKLNNAEMEVSDGLLSSGIAKASAVHPLKYNLPEGISRQDGVSAEKLQEIFEQLGIRNPKEAVVAGKFPMYNRQRFGTGMGKGIDDLLKDYPAQIFTVESGCRSDRTVKLHYSLAAGKEALGRIFIHAKAGSESTFLLYYSALPEECEYLDECGKCEIQQELREQKLSKSEEGSATDGRGFVGAQTYLYLEKGAKVHFSAVQMLQEEAVFFHDIGTFLAEESELTMAKLDLGAGTVYEGLNTLQAGDESRFDMDFGFLGLPGSFMDINYNDVFLGKKAEGRMYFKEALMKGAEKSFRGTVDFRQYSTGSKGDEQEDIILLGEDIINKTIPLILCEEEDVDGRHAATIGSLAEDMLFYMQSRGISKKKAEEMVVRATLQHISGMIPSESVKKAVKNYICRIFE